MPYETIEERNLIDGLKLYPITLGLVLRLTVENSAKLIENLQEREDVHLVFIRSSPGRLYVSNTPPDERRRRTEWERVEEDS